MPTNSEALSSRAVLCKARTAFENGEKEKRCFVYCAVGFAIITLAAFVRIAQNC
jgi:hypothetical protein